MGKLRRIEAKLDLLLLAVRELRKVGARMSQELDALSAEVESVVGIEMSAITLIEGLAQQIEDLKDDPAQLVSLAARLHEQSAALAAAITANAPPPSEPPPSA